MIDYGLLEVIENGATLPKTQVVEGVTIVMPITTVEEMTLRRLEVKSRSTLIMGISNEHQLKFNSIKDVNQLLEAVEKRFKMLDQTFDRIQKLVSQLELLDEKLSQEDVNQKLLRSLSPEWNTHVVVWRKKADVDTMSMDDLYNNLKVYELEVKGMSSSGSSTQNMALCPLQITTLAALIEQLILLKKLILLMEFLLLALIQPSSPQLVHEDLEQIHPDDINQDNKYKESSRKSVLVETTNSTALVSCDGLDRYDWSDRAEKELNYALMAFSFSSSNQRYLMTLLVQHLVLETVKLLKSQNDQLLKDLKKSKLMVLGNFMHGKPDLSFTGLDEFVNKPVAENCKAKSSKEEPKVDCNYHQKHIQNQRMVKPVWKNAHRVQKHVILHVKLEWRQNLSKITFCYHYGLLIHHFPKIQRVPMMMDPNLQVMMERRLMKIQEKNECNDQESKDNVNSTNNVNIASLTVNTAGINRVNVVGENISIEPQFDPNMLALEDVSIFDVSRNDGEVADMSNLDTTIQVFRNKKDERRIVIRNKARLVAQGYTQEEEIDYDEVFAPISRIEAIRLFLAYTSSKDFVVYQMDIKSALLYKKIKEEVYVCQLPGFEDPYLPDRVCKVKKALYGLHQALRAWKPKRKDTQVPQPSGPTKSVADEVVHKELGDRLVRAATTYSSSEAEQDSGNINKTQSKATPNESSSQGTDSGGGPKVLDLEKIKTTQCNEIDSFKRRVKKLEKRNRSRTHKLKRLYKVDLTARVESSREEVSLGEDASKQERRIDDIDVDTDITLLNDADNEMFDVDMLGGKEMFVEGQDKTVTTEEITLAKALKALKTSKLKAKRIVFQDPGYKLKDLKSKKFDEIQEMFDREFKRVNTFEDFRTELMERKDKRAGEELIQESTKKQKSPRIVDLKIHKKGKKSYYQIVRANGKSQMYMVFSKMFKSFDREDLEDLCKLVKAKFKSTRPMEDFDLLLRGDLKIMFEPHVEDKVWKLQQRYKVLNWKLLEPALYEITLATPSSRNVPNSPPLTPFVPPSRHEWDLMFQPVFDEFFNSPSSVASLIHIKEALALVESTSSPSLTTIDQNAPSPKSLKKYRMKSRDPVDTLMVEKSKLDEDPQGIAVDLTHYRGMVDTLIGAVNRGLLYSKDSAISLIAFANVDCANCQDTRRSTSGMFRDILNICPKIQGQEFDEPPTEEEALSFIRKLGHFGENKYLVLTRLDFQEFKSYIKMYYKKNLNFVALIWEDLAYQIDNMDSKKHDKIFYHIFTKIIIHHFLDKDKPISIRNRTFMHTARDDSLLGTMRFVSIHADTQVYSGILPKAMINQGLLDSIAYKTYCAISSVAEPPKSRKSQKKSYSASLSEESPSNKKSTKAKKVIATKPKLTKKKAPVKADKGKGLNVLSKVALSEAAQLKEATKQKKKDFHISQAIGLY
nr:copia protein [Tanacetum cinerariifolium]